MEEDKKEQNTENANAGAQNPTSENVASNEAKEEDSAEAQNIAPEDFKVVASNDAEKKEESVGEKQEEKLIKPADGKKDEESIKSKKIYPDVIPGASVKIYQKIKEKKGKEEKERIQVFEGIVLARKGGNEIGATITVRKICKGGFDVKKIYPIHLPAIAKIEVLRQAKIRKAKLGFFNKNYKKKLKYS